MKILSLFDGISCARVALERAGIPVEAYYASEIDKYAIQISQKNWPDIKQIGGVSDIYYKKFGQLVWGDFVNGDKQPRGYSDVKIDLMIGGSPCQDLSIAKKNRKGLDGERSGLFWEYVRILHEVKPKYFILENVASMSKEAKDIISEALGVQPIIINASLVSAQQRKRLFWTNIPGVVQPEDRQIFLKDIIHETRGEEFDLEKYIIKGNHLEWVKAYSHDIEGAAMRNRGEGKKLELNKSEKANSLTTVQTDSCVRVGKIGKGGQGGRIYSIGGKSVALSALGGGGGAKTGLYLVVPEATKIGFAVAGDSVDLSFPTSKTRRGRVGKKAKNLMTSQNIGIVGDGYVRKLTPTECGRLQGLPDGYLDGISDSQAYKCAGNAFNVDVVAHILSFIK